MIALLKFVLPISHLFLPTYSVVAKSLKQDAGQSFINCQIC